MGKILLRDPFSWSTSRILGSIVRHPLLSAASGNPSGVYVRDRFCCTVERCTESRQPGTDQEIRRVLPPPPGAFRAGLHLRRALRRAGTRFPDGGGAFRRPVAAWRELGFDPGRLGGPARDLPGKHRPDGG